jgi:DeoR/GlpR family transcriptional regulator of sugar metabolism
MLGIERRRQIIAKLKQEKRVYVSELAKLMNVTEETIRRDLEKLEDQNLLRRSYGGAVLNEHVSDDISFHRRSKINNDSKQRIAEKAAALIKDGDTIMVDSSTTCLTLLSAIQYKKDLTIITNSVNIVHDFLQSPFTLISTGGKLRQNSCALVGPVTIDTIHRYFVDLALCSCKGLDREKGIMESNDEESLVKQSMASRAQKAVLLADHSKFGRTSFVHTFDFDVIDTIVTDEPPEKSWIDFLNKAQISLID